LAGGRWAGAVVGAALAGLWAGLIGGLLLVVGPGSRAASTVPVVLALVGTITAALGAAGVAAGLAAAEALARSFRGTALVALGAVGGAAIGSTSHLLGRWTLEGLFGGDLSPVGGGFEGLVLGGAVGLGYALSTRTVEGGMAAPRGTSRLLAAMTSGMCCALAAVALSQTGSYLGAMSLDLMARSFPGSQVGLAPLAHLFGEAEAGRLTAAAISAWEGGLFGSGLILGLTRRPG
jgi:hypothetical protein